MSNKTNTSSLLFKEREGYYRLKYNPGFGPFFPEQETIFLFREAIEQNEPDYLNEYDEIKPGDQILVELDYEHKHIVEIMSHKVPAYEQYVPTIYIFNSAKSPNPDINIKAARRCI